MRSEKEKQILEFVKKHSEAPLQRTPAWIFLRRSVVGASELAALVGMSPYGNFESVALKKSRAYSSSFSTPACWWGTIFEDVAVKYAEREFMTKIHGTRAQKRMGILFCALMGPTYLRDAACRLSTA